jgi:multidrug efflux pump subunit AcrB
LSARRTGIKSRWIASWAALLGGCWLAADLPVEWSPSVELPALQIEAYWPGASPRAVERMVTAPLERAIDPVSGVRSIRSLSEESRAFLVVELDPDARPAVLAAEVADRARAVQRALPAGVIPRLSREVPEALREAQGFLTLQLIGADLGELSRVARQEVARQLLAVPGVANVRLAGLVEEELAVTVDRDALDRRGATLNQLEAAIFGRLQSGSLGWLRQGSGQRQLAWLQGVDRAADLGSLPLVGGPTGLGGLRLADLARLKRRLAPPASISRIDRLPVVSLFVDRQPGSHLLEVAEKVHREVARIARRLPPGVRIDTVDDRSVTVVEALRDLTLRAGAGLVAVIFVLLLVLGSTRAALHAIFGAAVAMAVGLALLRPLGLTFNLVTLAALSLLFGFLVDNSLIVVQQLLHLARRRSGRTDPADLARRALRSTWLPALGGTLSTIAVFVPIAFAGTELRVLFAPLALMASATLLVSLLLPAFLARAWAEDLSRRAGETPASRPPGFRPTWLLARLYAPFAANPRIGALVLLLAVGLPTPLVPPYVEAPPGGFASPEEQRRAELFNRTLGSPELQPLRRVVEALIGGVTRPFLEEVRFGSSWTFDERREIRLTARLPFGSSLEATEQLIRDFEIVAAGHPAVRKTILVVGQQEGFLQVLCDEKRPLGDALELRERLVRKAVDLGGVEISIQGLVANSFYSGLGEAAGFLAIARGSSYEHLEELAGRFEKHVRSLDSRIAQVRVDAHLRGQREDLGLRWGPAEQARTGLAADQIIGLLQPLLAESRPAFFARLDGSELLPIRFELAGIADWTLDRLLDQPLRAAGGAAFRLSEIATPAKVGAAAAIEREDQRYSRYIEVLYRGSVLEGRQLMEKAVASFKVPLGAQLELYAFRPLAQKSRGELLRLVAASTVVVFLILAAVLDSWSLAAIVMLAIPMSWIGIAGAFAATGQPFGEGAFLGLILTIGVCVNNSVLLASVLRDGQRAHPATPGKLLALQAIRRRLVAMWSTTLASCVGLLPMILLPEKGNFWSGLSLAVIAGLLASTLLSPAITVAAISWRERRER